MAGWHASLVPSPPWPLQLRFKDVISPFPGTHPACPPFENPPELWQDGTLDSIVPWFPWPDIAVSPEGPFAISTFALSLLLVFRTNSSYERW